VPRVAIAQIRPAKGDYAANVARIGGVLAQIAALDPKVDLVVTPETVTSGYFVEGGVRDVAVTAGTMLRDLADQHRTSHAPPLDVAVGFYELFQNHYFNSCLYASLGGKKPLVRHVHRKVFLPTYGVFDEERFVDRGQGIQAFDTGFGARAAILICEDAWHSLSATIAALDGAQLLIVPSASPARGSGAGEDGVRLPASVVRWERVIRGIAEEHGVFVAYASLVGFEGGKGFPGGSLGVSPMGEIMVRGPIFEEAVLTVDLNFDELTHARADSPLLSDLQTVVPHLIKNLGSRGTGRTAKVKFDPPKDGKHPRAPSPGPRVPLIGASAGPDDPLHLDVELARRWLVSFLRDEVLVRRGFKKGIVGLSGGVDSALTAYLAAEALGRENIVGVRLPYRTSSRDSLEHAQLVIDKLGIQSVTVDISAAVDGYVGQVGGDQAVDPGRKGNVMARERMIALFDLSAKYQALPLGTGNKTERLLGYFTWHADDSPPVNPLGDLFKTQVWALARHLGVPEMIVSKPATADLTQGQTDEADFGLSYPKVDRILYYLIRGFRPEEIVARGFTAQEVELVRKRLDSTHWKRRLPTVAVMSQTAIGEFYLRPVDY
jgi:NAD+ synthase (glutamine-hydrolysing)